MADKTPNSAASKSDPMRVDSKLVRELAELLTANELTEIEVEDGDRRVRVCRDPAPVIGAMPAPAVTAAPAAPPAAASTAASSPAGDDAGGEAIKSPMVGTVFLSPEPGAAPFIAVGDSVKAGDTLMIIEAMKVMNPIIAPHAGTIKKVAVADAQPVEFDQPLVILA